MASSSTLRHAGIRGPLLFALATLAALLYVRDIAQGRAHAREPNEVPKRVLVANPVLVPLMRAQPERAGAHLAFVRLPELEVFNLNNQTHARLRLYDHRGRVRPDVMAKLHELLGDVRKPDAPRFGSIDPRLIQLMFRAAYHFHAQQVVIISGYREARGEHEGLHAQGKAVDFTLPGVRSARLATYLRQTPRAGVGFYAHPETDYVHLDVRERSYHWIDGSAPGEPREAKATTPQRLLTRLDRGYVRSADWPERTKPPSDGKNLAP
ncbi:MAG: DUF882 domain-containing protein [Polyangiaceae bacterium]|nr:DUF882 domain-containing protein [Polyangiaceae bacterium]